MENLGSETNNGSFEREVIEFELDLELSSFKGWGLWSCDGDNPESRLFSDDNVISKWMGVYCPASSFCSLTSLACIKEILYI